MTHIPDAVFEGGLERNLAAEPRRERPRQL